MQSVNQFTIGIPYLNLPLNLEVVIASIVNGSVDVNRLSAYCLPGIDLGYLALANTLAVSRG